MMMTSSRMMVTRQPIRMAVFLSSGGFVAVGLVSEEKEEWQEKGFKLQVGVFFLEGC